MTESLHMLLDLLVTALLATEDDDWQFARGLFDQRDDLMENIRRRMLAADPATPARVQEALFQTTILFERALWLARDSLPATPPSDHQEAAAAAE